MKRKPDRSRRRAEPKCAICGCSSNRQGVTGCWALLGHTCVLEPSRKGEPARCQACRGLPLPDSREPERSNWRQGLAIGRMGHRPPGLANEATLGGWVHGWRQLSDQHVARIESLRADLRAARRLNKRERSRPR